MPDWGWLLFAYVMGSVVTYGWGFRKGFLLASNNAIDYMIKEDLVRASTKDDGEVQLHKWYDKE